MSIVDKLYHSISKYDIHHETSLPLFANAWSMLRSFPSLFADLSSKRASKYSDSENIFHVFVHLYLYKFSLAFISSWESKNVTLFIFWLCTMKIGLKKKQSDTWHLFKQMHWEPVEIGHHEWMIIRILTVSFLAIKSAIVKFCDLRTSLTTGTCDQNIFDDSFQGIWKYFNRICWKQRLIVSKV